MSMKTVITVGLFGAAIAVSGLAPASAEVLKVQTGQASSALNGLCCTNPVRDSCCESSVIAGMDEQTEHTDLQNPELARV